MWGTVQWSEIHKLIGSSDIDFITHLQYDKLVGLPRREKTQRNLCAHKGEKIKPNFPPFSNLFLQHGNDSDPFHLGNTYGGIPTNLVSQFFQESLFARRGEEAECAKESCCD